MISKEQGKDPDGSNRDVILGTIPGLSRKGQRNTTQNISQGGDESCSSLRSACAPRKLFRSLFFLLAQRPKADQDLFINPYPTAFPYGNGMVLHFYQQQESSTTKTVHRVINKRLKTYV